MNWLSVAYLVIIIGIWILIIAIVGGGGGGYNRLLLLPFVTEHERNEAER